MFNSIIKFILIIFFLCNNTYGFNNSTDYIKLEYQLENIKEIPVHKACVYNEDCPDYSWNCLYNIRETIGVCDINVYCNKVNGCIALKESYFTSNNTNNIIIDSFQNEMDAKDKNSLQKCQNDSDCFSNKCQQGICLVDNSDPIINCRIYDYFVKDVEVICAKSTNQKCNHDDDCISDYCNDNTCDSYEDHKNSVFNYYILLYIFGGVVVAGIIIILLYNYCCRCEGDIQNVK